MIPTRPAVPRAAHVISAVRPVLVSLAVAVTISLAAAHLSTHEAPATTGSAAVPGGATTNQFAGGAIPVPPRPV